MPLSFPFLLLSGASAILSFLQASLLLFFPFYLSLHSLRIFLSSTKYLFSFKRRFSMLLIGIALHMYFNFFSRRRFALPSSLSFLSNNSRLLSLLSRGYPQLDFPRFVYFLLQSRWHFTYKCRQSRDFSFRPRLTRQRNLVRAFFPRQSEFLLFVRVDFLSDSRTFRFISHASKCRPDRSFLPS